MKILVTAGKTHAMLDAVRLLANVFTGETGTNIAVAFCRAGHEVVLLTSAPELVPTGYNLRMRVRTYFTFEDLRRLMEEEILSGVYDAVIHSAAVGDYESTGRTFEVLARAESGSPVIRRLPARGKIPSGYPLLLFEVRPTEKLVDLIRRPWGFHGLLVKFKLQVDNDRGEPMSDEELIAIAQRSRAHSDADCIVANCYAWAHERAIVMGRDDEPHHVTRDGIAEDLLARIS